MSFKTGQVYLLPTQMGRSGLGAQYRRTSEMRPKRASSWNISLMAWPVAESLRMEASVSGSFFQSS